MSYRELLTSAGQPPPTVDFSGADTLPRAELFVRLLAVHIFDLRAGSDGESVREMIGGLCREQLPPLIALEPSTTGFDARFLTTVPEMPLLSGLSGDRLWVLGYPRLVYAYGLLGRNVEIHTQKAIVIAPGVAVPPIDLEVGELKLSSTPPSDRFPADGWYLTSMAWSYGDPVVYLPAASLDPNTVVELAATSGEVDELAALVEV